MLYGSSAQPGRSQAQINFKRGRFTRYKRKVTQCIESTSDKVSTQNNKKQRGNHAYVQWY